MFQRPSTQLPRPKYADEWGSGGLTLLISAPQHADLYSHIKQVFTPVVPSPGIRERDSCGCDAEPSGPTPSDRARLSSIRPCLHCHRGLRCSRKKVLFLLTIWQPEDPPWTPASCYPPPLEDKRNSVMTVRLGPLLCIAGRCSTFREYARVLSTAGTTAFNIR